MILPRILSLQLLLTLTLFGELWRKCGLIVSPKVHIIESHLNDFMRRFGRLGILTDDTMESTWPEDHLWSRVYSCILNWQKRTELIHARQMSSRQADVQNAANKGGCVSRVTNFQKKEPEKLPEPKTYLELMDHIETLQDPHPFHDIFGTGLDSSDADDIFDDIEAEVEEDIEHAAANV